MLSSPQYNTPEYWKAVNAGHISWEDAERAEKRYQDRRMRSLQTCHRYSMTERPRYEKPNTGAYTPEMSVKVQRDKNLYRNAVFAALFLMEKAYRQARDTRTLRITVSYIAKGIDRSVSTVRRYLRSLEEEGYIRIDIVRHVATGMVACLEITLLKSMFPRHHKKQWPQRLEKPDRSFLTDKESLLVYIGKESRKEWALKCMNGVWEAFMKTSPLLDKKPIPI